MDFSFNLGMILWVESPDISHNVLVMFDRSDTLPVLYFLMRIDLYFHVGFVPKIESGASHYIKI